MPLRWYVLGGWIVAVATAVAGCGSPATEGYTRYSNALFAIEVPSEWQVIDGTRLTVAEFETEMALRTGRSLEEVQQSGAGRLEMFAFQVGESEVAGLWPATLTLESRTLAELGGGDKERLLTGVSARIEALGGEVLTSDTERVMNGMPVVVIHFSEPWVGPEVGVYQYFFMTPTQGWILTLTLNPGTSVHVETIAQSFAAK